MNPETAWRTALGELQLQMTKATFDTWLKQSSVVAYEDGTFIVGVQNGYAKEWLDNRLLGNIKRTLTGVLGRSVELRFVVEPQVKKAPQNNLSEMPDHDGGAALPTSQPKTTTSKIYENIDSQSGFCANPDYVFDKFIVGSSNRLAHAAALAITETPAQKYNPLFLYGGVGLGKTHLLQAVGHQAEKSGLKALYVSSETFVNELINSIRTQSQESFRARYRTTDFLLIDDIQFIAGKESTQEEFFHTFNALYATGKQIVLTSDHAPQSINTLEERLSSRFLWGLIADVQPPDLEMRIAILRSKVDFRSAHVPDDVVYFIARQMKSNIRELEGGLNRVLAYASLMGVPVSLSVAQQSLSTLVNRKARVNLNEIVDMVCHHYGISQQELVGSSRRKEFVYPRQIAMYLAREETSASLPEIGQHLGGRDHTTVLHGHQKMASKWNKTNLFAAT